MHYREIKYGFEWGSAKITRFFSDEKAGWVTLRIKTPKEDIQIYITKTGKVKMYEKDGTKKK